MDLFWYFILFFVGVASGSFLNVISMRYQPGRRLLTSGIISGRSRCPACGKQLKWYELIPLLSFIVQFGKCRNCGAKLSWQYPLVELLSGLIFVFVPFVLVASGYTLVAVPIWILIFLLFLLLSIIDFRHYIIPDSINLSLAALGGLLVIASVAKQSYGQSSFLGHYALLFDFGLSSLWSLLSSIWLSHLFAAILAMFFFGAIIILSRGKAMGWGDFKLVGVLGLIFGWPDVIMVLMLSFLAGGIFSAALLIKGKKKMKDAVPFGPFLVIGATLTFFFGFQIINGYFKFFGL